MIPTAHIHPILVHFPIVFFLTLAALDTIASLRGVAVTGRSGAGNASAGLALLAGGFSVVTYVFGGMALDIAEAGGFHSDVAEVHEQLGGITMGCFAAWAVIRTFLWLRNVKLRGAMAVLLPAVEVAGAILVVATAYYGGELVYQLGVNVTKLASNG